MIVRFTSSKAGEMIMFAEHARRIFDLLGKAGSARGVFTTEQLPEAIAQLRSIIESAKAEERARAEAKKAKDEDEADAKKAAETVGLAQRATPLLRLMERTLNEDGYIVWEAANDF